jgi:hypothetical protein
MLLDFVFHILFPPISLTICFAFLFFACVAPFCMFPSLFAQNVDTCHRLPYPATAVSNRERDDWTRLEMWMTPCKEEFSRSLRIRRMELRGEQHSNLIVFFSNHFDEMMSDKTESIFP